MEKPISFDGIQMRVISTADTGAVNAKTLFTFTQEGEVVSASYSGGEVRLGYLVGVISPEGLRFRYAQLNIEGRLDGGYSTCEISKTHDGRIHLIEHFKWDSRPGSGTNVFEELPPDR